MSSTGPQIRFSYVLPEHVLVPEGEQRVGWWEADSQKWFLNGVADVGYEPESRTLSFLTPRLASVALLQPMDLELPYKKWLITPDGVSRCRLVLQTQRFLLEMDVEARGVTLRAPAEPRVSWMDAIGPTGMRRGRQGTAHGCRSAAAAADGSGAFAPTLVKREW